MKDTYILNKRLKIWKFSQNRISFQFVRITKNIINTKLNIDCKFSTKVEPWLKNNWHGSETNSEKRKSKWSRKRSLWDYLNKDMISMRKKSGRWKTDSSKIRSTFLGRLRWNKVRRKHLLTRKSEIKDGKLMK